MEAYVHGCRIAYRYDMSDQANASTILFLHGWGCDGSIFSTFANDIRRHANVLSVDFPGHGQSDEPPQPWGVPEYAVQILALLDELSIDQVDIIAHSFGGRISIWLASHAPERIGKMIITGGAGLRKPASETQSKKQKQYQYLKKILETASKVPFLKNAVYVLLEKLRQHYGSADYKRLNENMRKTFVKVITQDLSELLPSIHASTLLVWGSNDTETPLWMGKKMESDIPDAGLVVFEGRTHFAFLEEANRFLVIVKTFLFGGKDA